MTRDGIGHSPTTAPWPIGLVVLGLVAVGYTLWAVEEFWRAACGVIRG